MKACFKDWLEEKQSLKLCPSQSDQRCIGGATDALVYLDLQIFT